MARLALVDDHILLRKGLAQLLAGFGYEILFEADNGRDMQKKIEQHQLPDIFLIDINMPEMDGYESALWLKNTHPTAKTLALSMYDNETSIIRMLKNGAKGYVLKDSDPQVLRAAIEAVLTKGFYYSDLVSGKLLNAVTKLDEESPDSIKNLMKLNSREIEFLKFACTEMTYKEIADKMFISPRTVDGYRDDLFEKLNIKTRVGLAMYAIRNNIVSL